MRGYISYADNDLDMYGKIRTHLKPIEHFLDVAFSDNGGSVDGHELDEWTADEIQSSDIFIVLVSPSYLASDFIHKFIIPAMKERIKKVNALLIPVILTDCAWEFAFGRLRAFPTSGAKVMPISRWRSRERGYDAAGQQVAGAISTHFGIIPRGVEWPTIGDLARPVPLKPMAVASDGGVAGFDIHPFALEELVVRNFKGIAEIRLDFTGTSALGGNWTCIAGINASGKTSILQSLCLLLLGLPLIPEMGGDRLHAMWRRTIEGERPPELTLRCRTGDTLRELFLPFATSGIDRPRLETQADGFAIMNAIWNELRNHMILSYGATRNVSDYRDTRYAHQSRQVRRQMTLFDPSAQVSNVDVLLGDHTDSTPAVETFNLLIPMLFDEADFGKLTLTPGEGLRFHQQGADLTALDLADGFRSTFAWLADLCTAWHETDPERSRKPQDITGIVLIDEIDLHLHATLQRRLVPALRKALPKVQFIITTHSPLVLSCFDRRELVILDRDSEGGIRTLDRQLFGMSMDDIYRWLMDTPPDSPVIEAMLRDADPSAAVLLAQSPDTTEREAEERVTRRRAFLRRLRTDDKPAA